MEAAFSRCPRRNLHLILPTNLPTCFPPVALTASASVHAVLIVLHRAGAPRRKLHLFVCRSPPNSPFCVSTLRPLNTQCAGAPRRKLHLFVQWIHAPRQYSSSVAEEDLPAAAFSAQLSPSDSSEGGWRLFCILQGSFGVAGEDLPCRRLQHPAVTNGQLGRWVGERGLGLCVRVVNAAVCGCGQAGGCMPVCMHKCVRVLARACLFVCVLWWWRSGFNGSGLLRPALPSTKTDPAAAVHAARAERATPRHPTMASAAALELQQARGATLEIIGQHDVTLAELLGSGTYGERGGVRWKWKCSICLLFAPEE